MARSLSLHLHIIFVESHNKSFSSYNVLILRCLVGRKQRIKKNLFWVYIYIFIVHFYGAIGVNKKYMVVPLHLEYTEYNHTIYDFIYKNFTIINYNPVDLISKPSFLFSQNE